MKYGIELEFFVTKDGEKVPAYRGTSNVDGNPVVGELRTGVFNSIGKCVFDLKRLIYQERLWLGKRGYVMHIIPEMTVNDDFIRNLRQDRHYTDKKEYTDILSIYGEAKYNVLPVNKFKASLQINVSKDTVVRVTEDKEFIRGGSMFDYVGLISKLDNAFKDEIKASKRTKGIYAIKRGEVSDRIEYRSLPNTVDLYKIIEVLT